MKSCPTRWARLIRADDVCQRKRFRRGCRVRQEQLFADGRRSLLAAPDPGRCGMPVEDYR